MSFGEYIRSLELLEGPDIPTTRAELALARSALRSLHSATIGAGSNTWRAAESRYARAVKRWRSFPQPCEASLVINRCQNLAQPNEQVCKKCHKDILDTMERTMYSYNMGDAPHIGG